MREIAASQKDLIWVFISHPDTSYKKALEIRQKVDALVDSTGKALSAIPGVGSGRG